ncbi:tetratricopeptide repeat protein [Flavobacterium sp.]|uniref:tetratricopeptide repeat protein n=1 Tax=Flavobacterium sp. TaxID=239 RepID=UPI003D6B9EEC
MKIKNLVIATSLIFSVSTFAQKDELKTAEKALKSGNPAEAKTALTQAESLIANADDSQKAQFYFLKGNTYFDLAKKKVDEDKNLEEAVKAFNMLLETERKSGKSKYSSQAQTSLNEVKRELTNSAIADSNSKKFKESALKLYQVYQLDKKDSIMLYYAASTAINAQDFDLALDYYNKLKEINYSGKGINYSAKSKLSDKDETFNSKKERDDAVRIGTHTDPKVEEVPSKRGEIYKNISLIYIQKNDVPSAKKAIVDARKTNPEDVSLIVSEADLYLKTNDFDTYKKLITEVIAKNPKDADLFYNLAVISSQSKDDNAKAEAEKNYIKAIEIDPKYKNAYINLAILKLSGEKELVDQMNKLGTSPADNKKYDVLKAKREALYKSALPYLEKADELFAGDKDIKSTLLNVYNALDMTEKYKALKARN